MSYLDDVIDFLSTYTNIPIHKASYVDSNLPWEAISLIAGHLIVSDRVSIGSLLHEAGHIILTPYDYRQYLTGWTDDVIPRLGDDVLATYWGCEVCRYIDIPTYLMFSEGFGSFDKALRAMNNFIDKPSLDLFNRAGLLTKQGDIIWDPSRISY